MDININNIITSISNKNNFLNCIIDYCKNFKSKNDTNIYLVGGIVRDSFIDKSITKNMDIDIAVDGDIDKFVNEEGFYTQIPSLENLKNDLARNVCTPYDLRG